MATGKKITPSDIGWKQKYSIMEAMSANDMNIPSNHQLAEKPAAW